MVLVEGIAVSGEYVENLKDKKFVVITAPHYYTFKNKDDKEEKKVVMNIEMNGAQMEYHPNKTSLRVMVRLEGYEMDRWIGKIFEFEVVPMKVSGQDRKVLYVKEVQKN